MPTEDTYFSHGKLYVGCSRIGNRNNRFVFACNCKTVRCCRRFIDPWVRKGETSQGRNLPGAISHVVSECYSSSGLKLNKFSNYSLTFSYGWCDPEPEVLFATASFTSSDVDDKEVNLRRY